MRVQTDGIELVGKAKDAAPLGSLGEDRARNRQIRDRDDASGRDRVRSAPERRERCPNERKSLTPSQRWLRRSSGRFLWVIAVAGLAVR